MAALRVDAEHVLNLCASALYVDTTPSRPAGTQHQYIVIEPFSASERAFSVGPARWAHVDVELTHVARRGAASARAECAAHPLLCYDAASVRLSARLETHLITHTPALVIVANEIEARAIAPLLRARGHAARVAWPPAAGAPLALLALE